MLGVLSSPAHRLGQFAARQRDPPTRRGSTGAGQAAARRGQRAGGGGGGGAGVGRGLNRLPQSQRGRGGGGPHLTGRRNWRQKGRQIRREGQEENM